MSIRFEESKDTRWTFEGRAAGDPEGAQQEVERVLKWCYEEFGRDGWSYNCMQERFVQFDERGAFLGVTSVPTVYRVWLKVEQQSSRAAFTRVWF